AFFDSCACRHAEVMQRKTSLRIGQVPRSSDRPDDKRQPAFLAALTAAMTTCLRQPLQRPTIGRSVVEEVPGPPMVLGACPPADATVAAVSQPPLLPLFPWDLEALLPPQPPDPLAVDPPALTPQEGPNAPVAKARVLAN